MRNINQIREFIFQKMQALKDNNANDELQFELFFENNSPSNPTGDSCWVLFQLVHVNSVQTSMGKVGNRRFERRGAITAIVNTPSSTGTEKADLISNMIKNEFEGISDGDFYTIMGTINELGTNESWYVQVVEVPFFYFEIR